MQNPTINQKRMVSGVQATGDLHLGNYMGALKDWVKMQESYDCFFFLADLHAITIPRDPAELKRSTIEVAAAFLACGLNPDKSTLFLQSHIHQHSELSWILACMTPLGWLNRMTQFKDKAGKDKELASTGLYTYPVLQAADILMYKPHFVPVGEDQKQHVELVRDIAGSVNRKFNKDIFPLPEPLIKPENSRIKSLRDGTKKMSKSDPSDQSRINLSDSKNDIYQKIKRAKTDSIAKITYEPESRPEVANLINIYSELAAKSRDQILKEYEGSGFAKFKEDLAECAAEVLGPITERYKYFLDDKEELLSIIGKGSEKARKVAMETILEVKREFGFWG